MKNNVVKIEVSTKKGHSQTLHFLVVLSRPYPDITASGSRLEWRNCDGLFGKYGQAARGLEDSYHAYLLRSDIDLDSIPEDFNRTHFAGYQGNPGTITLRGADLGEMTLTCKSWRSQNGLELRAHPEAAYNRVYSLTEKSWITDNIGPAIVAFIRENRGRMRAEAKEKIVAGMQRKIAEARKQIDLLETAIGSIVIDP